MAVSLLRTLVILVVIAGALICSGDVVSAQCGGSLTDLATQCLQFVQGKWHNRSPPSAWCCAEVTRFDMKCACNNLITQAIADVVDVPRAASVAQYCGVNLAAAGTQCGAITIPCSGEGLDC